MDMNRNEDVVELIDINSFKEYKGIEEIICQILDEFCLKDS